MQHKSVLITLSLGLYRHSPYYLHCWLQVMQLLAVDILVYIWHKLPIVGLAAGPVMQFISVRDSLGTHRAAALSILGPAAGALVWGPLEHWCFQFMRLWRASRVSFLDSLVRAQL